MRQLLRVSPKERPSASSALDFEYFDCVTHFHPVTEEDDHTLREYLLTRANRYFSK